MLTRKQHFSTGCLSQLLKNEDAFFFLPVTVVEQSDNSDSMELNY